LGLAVVLRVAGTQLRQPLAGSQGLDLGQGEVLGEPAGDLLAVDGLGRLAVGELGTPPTSVVPPISFSWRAIRWPSLVGTRSGSMKSQPWSMARL
jgi:hypothetical protein